MNTFVDLFEFLQNYEEKSIISWLDEPWKGKDKQESLLRLLAGLGLISSLSRFKIQKGNFNLGTITSHGSLKDVFYDEKNKQIKLKDHGDYSDLTGIYNEEILVTTSKNLNKENIGNFDIHKIKSVHEEHYSDKKMILCIVVRDKKSFKDMIDRSNKTSKSLKELIKKEENIIIDWYDLDKAYRQFKYTFADAYIGNLITFTRKPVLLKMSQKYMVYRIIKLKINGVEYCLLGAIQRSGKTYIIAGFIIEDSREKESCNYIILTTAPNETIEQFINVLDCTQLEDFNIIYLNGKNKDPVIKKKNIVICSKQFLQGKTEGKTIEWLKKMKFDARFIDESHNGATTDLAKKTFDNYGKNAFTVYVTATYSKPINSYKIPKEHWVLWDLEDIVHCKNYNKEELFEKHPKIKRFFNEYTEEDIVNEYSKYPDLEILSWKISNKVSRGHNK